MKFSCQNFNQQNPAACPFEIVEDETVIVNDAITHELEEHGYQDSPELRQRIQDSLVPVPD